MAGADDAPDARGDRLRARSGVEDLHPAVLWVWRTWWVNALVTLFVGGVAADEWATNGYSAEVALPGGFALLWLVVTAFQFREWRRQRGGSDGG